MITTTTLSHRDRAVLKAIAAGRCLVAGSHTGAPFLYTQEVETSA